MNSHVCLVCTKGIEPLFVMLVFFPNELIKWSLIYRVHWPVNLRNPNRPWHHGNNFFPYVRYELPGLICAHCLFLLHHGPLKGCDSVFLTWHWKAAIRTPQASSPGWINPFPSAPPHRASVCTPTTPLHYKWTPSSFSLSLYLWCSVSKPGCSIPNTPCKVPRKGE